MKELLSLIFCCGVLTGSSQFKGDNVKYQTVFPEDLCAALRTNPGYLLLDVRSEGEFRDTLGTNPGLNLGHLKNAVNINVNQLPQRWKELSAHKDQPVFVYCYSSQRSRRASRLLADSGFTRIININGGISNFYTQAMQSNVCDDISVVSQLPYKIISARELATGKKEYHIIDLRSDSIFKGITTIEKAKMQGRFSGAENIPFDRLEQAITAIPQKPILVVDESGSQSPLAARKLLAKGFKDVSILFNGMDEWVGYISSATEKPAVQWNSFSRFRMLSPEEFHRWMTNKRSFRLVDIRPEEQFINRSKNSWQNIGRIRNAVNIPYASLSTLSMPPVDEEPVVVYGFNSENEIFEAARWFRSQGHQNVYVLQGGIFQLRWAANNLKNKKQLTDWVIEVPAENQ